MDSLDINTEIGELLRSERKKLGLSQMDLAEDCDIHYNYLSEIERGRKSVTVKCLNKICIKGLGMSLSNFFDMLN